jgi:hypothetical protein
MADTVAFTAASTAFDRASPSWYAWTVQPDSKTAAVKTIKNINFSPLTLFSIDNSCL